jgi:hypothetical protein
MRKHNHHRSREERVSNHSRFLTPDELITARLTLAQDMVDLILTAGDTPTLPPAMHATLRGLLALLDEAMAQARQL